MAPKNVGLAVASPLKGYKDCSPEERSRYEFAYLASWHTLSYAIEVLSIRLDDPDLGPTARLGLRTEIRRLEHEQEILDLFEEAWRQGQAAISPPDDATVETAQAYTEQVQTLTNNANAAGRAIQLASQAVSLFRKLSSH